MGYANWQCSVEVADVGKGFSPIPALSQMNATISLIFASFPGSFQSPSEDLWLSAHRKFKVAVQSNGTFAIGNQYVIDQPVSALACAEHIQFCNPALSSNNSVSCSLPLSIARMQKFSVNGLKNLFPTKHQQATAAAILHSLSWGNFYDTVASLEPKVLAESLAATTLSLAPAPDQWVQEVTNWFSVGLANLQRLIVDYNTGPPSQFLELVPKGQAKNDEGLHWLCGNQVIRRNDFTNFRTLAIGLIFGLGAIVIGLSLCLETAVGKARSHWKRAEWRHQSWWSEETLHLQMKALERMKVKGWKLGDFAIPVTAPGKKWASMLSSWEMLPPVEGRLSDHDSDRDTVSHDKLGFKGEKIVELTTVCSSSTLGSNRVKRTRSMSV